MTDVALIGLGAVAISHLESYLSLPDVRVIAAVDPVADRILKLGGSVSSVFSSCEEMLRNVQPDVACVLTPASTHRTICEQLAARGVHVLCEKPLAQSLEDGLSIRDAIRRSGVRFCYGSSYRYLPAVAEARRLISSGAIGEVRLMMETVLSGEGADRFKPMGRHHYLPGGPGGGEMGLVDHGIHPLDIFPWLIRSPIESALGRGNISGGQVRPEYALLEHQCGAQSVLVYDESTVSAAMPNEGLFGLGRTWVSNEGFAGVEGQWDSDPTQFRIHGTGGALRIFPYANRLFLKCPGNPLTEIPLREPAAPHHFGRQLREFLSAIEKEPAANSEIDDALRALQVLHAIYRSAVDRRWVNVDEMLGDSKESDR